MVGVVDDGASDFVLGGLGVGGEEQQHHYSYLHHCMIINLITTIHPHQQNFRFLK